MNEKIPNLVFDGMQVDPNRDKIVLDHIKLIDMCMVAIENGKEGDEKVNVYLPIEEFLDTKLNKVYIISKDSSTPQGIIVRGDINALKFKPHACARYNAYDLMSWLVVLTDDIERQENNLDS